MKYAFLILLSITFLNSCSSLKSNTIIKPKDSFILGNNEHGSFKVALTNVSKNDLEIYYAPIAGGKHSTQIINPNKKINIKIDPNTALYIVNNSMDTASVNLTVTGDTGLSMGYKN